MRKARLVRLTAIALSIVVVLGGCGTFGESLKDGLSKAVLLEYDQVVNFKGYEFGQAFVVNTPNTEDVKTIHAGYQGVNGVWLTFVICKITNTESKAETFTLDVSKLYVDFDGKKYYGSVLPPYTFTFAGSFSDQVATPAMADGIRPKLREETQVGADKELISPNQAVFPNFRYTIFVSADKAVDASLVAKLQIDTTQPHVMIPRNQPPAVPGGNNPYNEVTAQVLPTTCRPPAS